MQTEVTIMQYLSCLERGASGSTVRPPRAHLATTARAQPVHCLGWCGEWQDVGGDILMRVSGGPGPPLSTSPPP